MAPQSVETLPKLEIKIEFANDAAPRLRQQRQRRRHRCHRRPFVVSAWQWATGVASPHTLPYLSICHATSQSNVPSVELFSVFSDACQDHPKCVNVGIHVVAPYRQQIRRSAVEKKDHAPWRVYNTQASPSGIVFVVYCFTLMGMA